MTTTGFEDGFYMDEPIGVNAHLQKIKNLEAEIESLKAQLDFILSNVGFDGDDGFYFRYGNAKANAKESLVNIKIKLQENNHD